MQNGPAFLRFPAPDEPPPSRPFGASFAHDLREHGRPGTLNFGGTGLATLLLLAVPVPGPSRRP